MSQEINKPLPSEEQLIAELREYFPNMHVRPIRKYGIKELMHGAWVGGGDDCVMPDGLPVFDHIGTYAGEEMYYGSVHVGFSGWLIDRGWYYEQDDCGVYLIIAIAELEDYFNKFKKSDEDISIDSSPNVHRISQAKNYSPF